MAVEALSFARPAIAVMSMPNRGSHTDPQSVVNISINTAKIAHFFLIFTKFFELEILEVCPEGHETFKMAALSSTGKDVEPDSITL